MKSTYIEIRTSNDIIADHQLYLNVTHPRGTLTGGVVFKFYTIRNNLKDETYNHSK